MFNLVVLTGRLSADPELKTTQNGISVTSFSIAVNRPHRTDGERQTDFINIVAWRKTAEFITHHFTRGSLIGIEGSIQTRKYTDRNGYNRIAFEVVANNVHFVESKRDSEPTADTASFSNASVNDFGDLDDVSDDDLPF